MKKKIKKKSDKTIWGETKARETKESEIRFENKMAPSQPLKCRLNPS